jgi:hypothetical protein
MKLRSALGVAVTAAAVATAGYAAAASLGSLGSASLGAGNSGITACDGDGVTTDYTVDAGNITEVIVSDIADPGCEGAALSLTLTDDTGTSLGAASSQIVPTDGDVLPNSMTVPISPQPDAALVTNVHIVIVGGP